MKRSQRAPQGMRRAGVGPIWRFEKMDVPEEMTLRAQASGLAKSLPGATTGRAFQMKGRACTKRAGTEAVFRSRPHTLTRNESSRTGGDLAGKSAGGSF